MSNGLQQYLIHSAEACPENVAVVQPGTGAVSYRELDVLTDQLRDRLVALGVEPGDRVGIYFPKSINSIASIYGILKAGGAYVPVDPSAPATRNAFVFDNCQCRVVIVDSRYCEALATELERLGSKIPLFVVEESQRFPSIADALEAATPAAPQCETHASIPQDLAYILYTSGSTGNPKGVMLTHENAVSFVDWCSATFEPNTNDRCSSHAPLHFDLSILDVHMTIKHAATLVLVDERAGKDPKQICQLIEAEGITIWYSAPSILALLVQMGALEETDLSSLRLILFAGEVFPIKYLRELKTRVPSPVYFNLYGPTETNVCTAFRVPEQIPPEQTNPVSIGNVCEHLEALVVDENLRKVARGDEGELLIRGGNVTQGYWQLPENNAKAFYEGDDGKRWYRTGDLVVEGNEGNYVFLGRRDRMVKKRGYRIELGEIEACLYRHENLDEVAVVAQPDPDVGLKIYAFYSSGAEKKPSIIALKAFCAQQLPNYMIPDIFVSKDVLPKTSTDKIDYQKLLEIC